MTHHPDTAADPRWPRIVARDAAADGAFWYSVVTTGIYCRPGCAARTANPDNVTIHDTLAAAQATGFRPCRRCRPDQPSAAVRDAALVAQACRTITEGDGAVVTADLAAAAGMSAAHFHRMFKRVTGVTPRAFAAGDRMRRLQAGLGGADSVTEAMHDAGYSSTGRFYAAAPAVLGMTPTRYRHGGAAETLRFAIGDAGIGSVLVASSQLGVAAILIGDNPDDLVRELQDRFPRAELIGGDRDYDAVVAQVLGIVDARESAAELPLDIRGTAFQQRVWQALRAIPEGSTASYADVARSIGAPEAVRAVAGACAANAHAVAIPCHRVVRSDGSLSGYRWGVERKRVLLARERGDA